MLFDRKLIILSIALWHNTQTQAFTFPNAAINTYTRTTTCSSPSAQAPIAHGGIASTCFSSNNGSEEPAEPAQAQPQNFREAEVLGLRFMQEGLYEDALKGMLRLLLLRVWHLNGNGWRTHFAAYCYCYCFTPIFAPKVISILTKHLSFFSFMNYKTITMHQSYHTAVFQKGLKLPGSRTDIIRTQNIAGPSPVGGSSGGTEGKVVQTLDEFEYQAAHYNIACAHASLDQIENSCKSLEQAFGYGFDNYATVRADPDLESVHGSPEFDNLMERFDSKKGFFGLFK
jgi:hypothetical protein